MSITQPAGADGQRKAGLPGPGWLEPQLATLTRDRFSDPGWIYERKLDGERCLAYRSGDRVLLMTRNQQDVSRTYPEVRDALAAESSQEFVCDGEIVAFDGESTSFSRLQQRLGVRDPGEELRRRVPVFYCIFDLLAAGDDLRRLPLIERKKLLAHTLAFPGPLRFTEHRIGDGVAYYEQACRHGWEGLIAKRADAPYRAGRSRDWLKFKCESGQELVIGGYTDPRGSRAHFGALLLGYYDQRGRLVYAGKVGTGFNEATLASLGASLRELERDDPPFDPALLPPPSGGGPPRAGVHWVEPALVAEVGFSEWTTAGQLRHPRYQGLRDDKDPKTVVRETPAP
ncbi:MAG TPA: non-homologous end-joining DNA ligase [Streptosporangiaceae bacterium]